MNSYIQLKAASDAQYWRLTIMFTGTFDAENQVNEFGRTADNKLAFTLGGKFKSFSGVAKLFYTNPPANYCSIAQFKKWALSGTVADKKLTLIDHFGNSHSVIIKNGWNPQYMSPVVDGVNSYVLVPIDLEQQ